MASFAEAFKAARKAKGAGATFTWNGKSYSTNYKEETQSKSGVKPKARPSTPEKSPRPRTRSDVAPKVMSDSPKQPKAPTTSSGVTLNRGNRAPAVMSEGPKQSKAPATSSGVTRKTPAEARVMPGSKANVPPALQAKIDKEKERQRKVAKARARNR